MAIDLKNPNTQKIALGIIALLGLTYGWYAYIFSPNQDKIAEKQTTLEELETKVQQARMKAAGLAKLKEEAIQLWAQYKAIEPLLPNKHEVTAFLSEMQRAAYSSGVQVTALIPQKTEAVDFYVKNPYRVSILGNYHNFGRFLARVANFPFITSVSEVTLGLQKPTPQNPITVGGAMTISAYNVKAEEVLQEPNFDTIKPGQGDKGAKEGAAGGTPAAAKSTGGASPAPPQGTAAVNKATKTGVAASKSGE